MKIIKLRKTLPSSCCSVTKLCLTLCDPEYCSAPGFTVLHYLLKFAKTHVHWVSDAIQPSHPLSPPFPLALNFLSIRVFSSRFALTISSVAQLCLTLWPHGLQHARLPCPSPTPRACSNSCPSSWWCHPTISSSVVPFSFLRSFPASGSF